MISFRAQDSLPLLVEVTEIAEVVEVPGSSREATLTFTYAKADNSNLYAAVRMEIGLESVGCAGAGAQGPGHKNCSRPF